MEAAELAIGSWVSTLDADSWRGDPLPGGRPVPVRLSLIEVFATFLLTVPSKLGIRLAARPEVPTLRRVISHAAKLFLLDRRADPVLLLQAVKRPDCLTTALVHGDPIGATGPLASYAGPVWEVSLRTGRNL